MSGKMSALVRKCLTIILGIVVTVHVVASLTHPVYKLFLNKVFPENALLKYKSSRLQN